jgi:uncharacterized protein
LLRPKFDKYVSTDKRLLAISAFEKKSQLIQVIVKVDICRDPKDNKFLELAIDSGAACIITWDKDLLVLNPFEGIPILTPADFLRVF